MPPIFWLVFALLILGMTALDLGVFRKKSHTVSFREAFTWTAIWVSLATGFGTWIWQTQGHQKGLEFFNGYLIELSLSADNVFIFALIFRNFAVPLAYQHKVLIWGVLSALVLRFIMIALGVQLVNSFSWILYIFGAFLLITGIKMLIPSKEDDTPHDPASNPLVRYARRVLPVTPTWVGSKFIVREQGRLMVTPLFIVLICIEISDVIFAVDSIPAVFGITTDQFIIFTSNVFAIMGLRSLYFVLAGSIEKFHYLKTGLGFILAFVGAKLLLAHTPYALSNTLSLTVTILTLTTSILASLAFPKKPTPNA